MDEFYPGLLMDGGCTEISLPKIYNLYPSTTKLGIVVTCLKKIRKYKNHMTHPLGSVGTGTFSPEIAIYAILENAD